MSADYKFAVPATVNLYTQTGHLNNIIIMKLNRVFFVTWDRGTNYTGMFFYNREQDMEGLKEGLVNFNITPPTDNKLSVKIAENAKGLIIAKFISTDDAPGIPFGDSQGEWLHVTPISQIISTSEDWKSKADMVAKQVPPAPSEELQKKRRWLQIIVRNETDFAIEVTGTYFGLGRYDQAPAPRLAPFSMGTFTACVGDGTVATGVTGATAYRMSMDQTHQFNFGIGYSNPYIGPFKVGVLETDDPKKAYDATTSATGSLISTNYVASEAGSGRNFLFRLHISVTAGQKPEFIITEDRFYSAV